MLQLDKILVARDFSPNSERALHLALDLARRTGASVHTLFAEVPSGNLFETSPILAMAHREAREQAEHAPKDVPDVISNESPHVEHIVVRDAAVGPAILNYATVHDVDLIVMATHGRRGVPRWLLGSIAEEVVRLSPCPVLTVRATKETAPSSSPSILVPIDFSKHAREALRQAKVLGTLLGARLDLLHVVEENLHPAFYGPAVQSIYDVKPDIEEQAVDQLKHFYQTTEGPGGDVHFEALPGKAALAIAKYADEHQTDLIVMATHGLTGLERFFIGSVAEKVVRHAPCPVLTVKSFSTSPDHGSEVVETAEATELRSIATP